MVRIHAGQPVLSIERAIQPSDTVSCRICYAKRAKLRTRAALYQAHGAETSSKTPNLTCMKIKFFTTGGTIDKVYFDAKSEFEVGQPQVMEILKDANIVFEYEIESILRKDSLDLTEADRHLIRTTVEHDPCRFIVVTHGTDTMVDTGRALRRIPGKTIVLTGSMQPARFRSTDAVFNIGLAIGAVQSLPPGVYIAFNGRMFDPHRTRKNRERNCFEEDGGQS